MEYPEPRNGLITTPIGFIRTGRPVKFDAPHQPDLGQAERSTIELVPGLGLERALTDLSGFDHIWLLWWFHRNTTWRPMVRPPRGDGKRRGVFATRSPHRPNPIGITAVKLYSVSGLLLEVGSTDLVDGTPILDIKPYLPVADSFPDSRIGWLQEIEEATSGPRPFTVSLEALAHTQLEWLRETWGIDFFTRAKELLERDPSPHRTRRICSRGDGLFRMGCGAWRLYFSVVESRVLVQEIKPGYPPRMLIDPHSRDVPHADAQRAFSALWGNTKK